ncbi:MAG: chemotaxis protein CheC [Flammeovirgaceae bacterium]
MILGLNQEEFEVAKELTNVALANATESFSKMTGDKFTFQDIEVNINHFQLDPSFDSLKEPLYIMLTEYLGDVLADTFLVINPENAEKIASMLYPSPNINEELKNAILLETDNIVAAAVATKYADFLNHSVTGDVPKMVRKSPSETQKYINDKLENDHTHFSFITNFKSEEHQLEAYFICAFRDSFGSAVKSIATKQETIDLLDEQVGFTKQYLRDR